MACCWFAASGCAWLRGDVPAPAEARPAPFQGERAFAHLEALVALGPRVAGTPAVGQARAYVRAELEGLGLSVHEDEFRFASEPGAPEQVLANLWAEIPGTHAGLFIVATPLDTPPGESPGANEGGSGAALLLELARALHERSLPYSVRLLFLDGDLLTSETAFLGSAHAHRSLAESGELQTLRLLLYVHQVGDRELEIRRDRSSDRVLREVFFSAARGAGLAAAFPSAAPYDDVRLGHRAFVARRFTRVVALADLRYGGPDIPGEHWRTPQDDLAHCSPESLAAVGTVVLTGLEAAAERQLVVDRASGAARPEEDGHP
jgi:hypothetical protein